MKRSKERSTVDKENPGACHSKRPHKRRPVSDEPSKSNGAIRSSEEQPVEIVTGPYFTPDALSVDFVLENIFRHLNGKDLEHCKAVNKRWNYLIGQSYTRHYEVTIITPRKHVYFDWENKILNQNHVTIQKLDWSSKLSDRKKFYFPAAVALLLEESSKERKFAIDLRNFNPKCIEDPAIEDFLSKIGHLVSVFTPCSPRDVFLDPLGRLSRHNFPNLCYLNLSHINIVCLGGPSWEDYNEYLRKNVFIKLRKISFGRSLEHFETAYSCIKMAPKLKEIHEFPVNLVDALISTGMSKTVKSICYPDYALIGEQFYDDQRGFKSKEIINGGPLEVALKKFAQLKPKLISFSFSITYPTIISRHKMFRAHYPTKYLYLENLKPSICQILQSSHQTLETLALYPSESFNFEEISPMNSLKMIQFIYDKEFDVKLIPSNIDMERVFPNVTAVEFVACYWRKNESFVSPTLLSPWGTQITELVLKESFHLDSTIMKALAESFPCVKNFKFYGSGGVAPDTLSWILPLIADLWPEVEVITIKMVDESDADRGSWFGYTFDNIFTGIPKKSLAQLKTPSERKKIPKEELESFYANSVIRKLSNLQTLELDFHYYSGAARGKFLMKFCKTCTFLSKEFGFDFLPPTFKILIRETGAEKYFYDQRDLKKIQEDFSSVVAVEFETIKMDDPHYF